MDDQENARLIVLQIVLDTFEVRTAKHTPPRRGRPRDRVMGFYENCAVAGRICAVFMNALLLPFLPKILGRNDSKWEASFGRTITGARSEGHSSRAGDGPMVQAAP